MADAKTTPALNPWAFKNAILRNYKCNPEEYKNMYQLSL